MDAEEALLVPNQLYTAAEVLSRDRPVPASPGVYGWYFAELPPNVPTTGCHEIVGAVLLYVGISPKQPPLKGRSPSRQTVRSRIRYHYRGNAEGSTLRLTLGCLLAPQLATNLRRVGSGNRMTFGREGEARLSAWMAEHAWVVWTVVEDPWTVEERLIKNLVLPLNLDQNRHSPFHQQLSALRKEQRFLARVTAVEA